MLLALNTWGMDEGGADTLTAPLTPPHLFLLLLFTSIVYLLHHQTSPPFLKSTAVSVAYYVAGKPGDMAVILEAQIAVCPGKVTPEQSTSPPVAKFP